MVSLPQPLRDLSEALNRLPGIGPRSAERLALHLLRWDQEKVRQLAETLNATREKIRECSICGALTENDPCDICRSEERDPSLICLVETPLDLIHVEKSGAFTGRYHVLGGRISPMNGIEPEDLRIAELESRLEKSPVKEIVLALGGDVEGDATSHYLAKRLARSGLTITRIAHGLPAGGGLEYADEMTLSKALEGRRQL